MGEPGDGKVGAILAFPSVHGLTLDFGKVPHTLFSGSYLCAPMGKSKRLGKKGSEESTLLMFVIAFVVALLLFGTSIFGVSGDA